MRFAYPPYANCLAIRRADRSDASEGEARIRR